MGGSGASLVLPDSAQAISVGLQLTSDPSVPGSHWSPLFLSGRGVRGCVLRTGLREGGETRLDREKPGATKPDSRASGSAGPTRWHCGAHGRCWPRCRKAVSAARTWRRRAPRLPRGRCSARPSAGRARPALPARFPPGAPRGGRASSRGPSVPCAPAPVSPVFPGFSTRGRQGRGDQGRGAVPRPERLVRLSPSRPDARRAPRGPLRAAEAEAARRRDRRAQMAGESREAPPARLCPASAPLAPQHPSTRTSASALSPLPPRLPTSALSPHFCSVLAGEM